MKGTLVIVLSSVFAAAAIVAATGQERAQAPGQPTQARVWIQNRGPSERVPVEITGTPRVQIAETPTVQARAVQQQWQYQTLTIEPGADPTTRLNAAGQQGWETTGLQLPSAGGTLVVLKRPR